MYRCKKCEHEFEKFRRIPTSMTTFFECPECGADNSHSEKLPDPPKELSIEDRLRRVEKELDLNF